MHERPQRLTRKSKPTTVGRKTMWYKQTRSSPICLT